MQFDITSNVQRCCSVFSAALYKNVEFVRRPFGLSWNSAQDQNTVNEARNVRTHDHTTSAPWSSQLRGRFSGTALRNLFSNFVKRRQAVSHGAHSNSIALPKQSENALQVQTHTKFLWHTAAHKIPVTHCRCLCSTQQNTLTAAAIRIFDITSFLHFDYPPAFQNHLLRFSVDRVRKHLLRWIQKHGLFWIIFYINQIHFHTNPIKTASIHGDNI
jgi:hypothetical protein